MKEASCNRKIKCYISIPNYCLPHRFDCFDLKTITDLKLLYGQKSTLAKLSSTFLIIPSCISHLYLQLTSFIKGIDLLLSTLKLLLVTSWGTKEIGLRLL